MKNTDTFLKIQDLKVRYGSIKVLESVDITINEGDIIALMGPNGAGKSTILKALFGLVKSQKGKIYWHEKQIVPKPYTMVQRGISFVPQDRQIFKSLTVYENMEMGGYFINNKKILKESISSVLKIFPDLKKKLSVSAGSLSGGQQQMLAIARGLVPDPRILLLDEPTLGLSPKIVKEVFAKIKEINKKRGTAIMIVEHNLNSVMQIVDRVYILSQGVIVKEDHPENIMKSGILKKVFLGKTT